MQSLLDFFAERRSSDAPLVLATVVQTEGSTYSKAGEQLLVDEHGSYRGLLSGGCLEGDLALRAREVLESGVAQLVDYDFRGEDDELFGLGVGCEGAIHVLLQCLTVANGYQPFRAISDTLLKDESAVLVTRLSEPGLGTAVLVCESSVEEFGLQATETVLKAASGVAANRFTSPQQIGAGEHGFSALLVAITPPPRLLVLGGGPDVIPLVRMANELGWRCLVVDHRPDYIEKLPPAFNARLLQAEDLASAVRLDDFDRAIVMSHHLSTDRAYLRQLSAAPGLRYIGLLGPPARRDRLLRDLAGDAQNLIPRLHGPAGIDIGGRGPAVIALSVLAQMQQRLGSN